MACVQMVSNIYWWQSQEKEAKWLCLTGYSPSAQEKHPEPTLWVCLLGTRDFSISALYKYAWDTPKSTKVTFEILDASKTKQKQMQTAIATLLFPLNCVEWNECLPSWHCRNGWGRRSFLGIDIFPNWDELTGRMKVHPRKTIKCALYHLRSPQRFHRKWKQTWQEEQCC